jgi:hypothetical protein
MSLSVSWIEVPAKDAARAAKFYSELLGAEYEMTDDGTRKTGILNGGGEEVTGFSVNQTANFHPHNQGPLVYLRAGDQMDALLAKIPQLGGKVIVPKTSMGFGTFVYAQFEDTEGNMLALSGQDPE